MSMTRQLLLVILALFLTLFAGTFYISVNNVRHFLNEQLETHAQDTATSLGLSLSPYMAKRDMATLGRMIDAINDSGYYKAIELESVDGEMLIERHNDTQFREVPNWFVDLVPLETPVASAVVMAGWKQAGQVRVSSHPGYAYAELWRNTVQTFQFFVVASLTALLLGLLALRYILRPLNAMEKQAEAICRQEYTVQDKVPRARELRHAVEAMNRMVLKIQDTFRDHAALADTLRQQAWLDSLTGLGNRRYFDEQLKLLVNSDEEFHHGGLLLIELHDLAGYNQRHGYEAGDRLLKTFAEILRASCDSNRERLVARLSGADFAILAPNSHSNELAALAETLSQSLLEIHTSGLADSDEIACIGVTSGMPGDTPDQLLSRADLALRQSQARGHNAWSQVSGEESAPARSATDWRRLLEQTLANQNVQLVTQPANSTREDTGILHQEVLLRIPAGDGELLPAGAFFPMAEQFGLARELDKLAITTLMQNPPGDANPVYAVNISCGALHDSSFLDWLYQTLENHTALAGRLVFEFPEFAVVSDLDAARSATARLHALGYPCGLDHFGRGFTSFSYLCSLRLQYVKIDGVYIRNIQDNPDNRFFVQALTRTLHGIDIQVIAENVESEAERTALEALQVDGIQGHLTGKPS